MKTTSISIKNKTKKTPSLRFKEFSGEWQAKKLTNLLSKIIDNRGKMTPEQLAKLEKLKKEYKQSTIDKVQR